MSLSVTGARAGTAGVVTGRAGAGQYHGRIALIVHTSCRVAGACSGAGTTMIVAPPVRVAGLAGDPGVVVLRPMMTCPPEIEPAVQSSTGGEQVVAARAGAASVKHGSTQASNATRPERVATARYRRGRIWFRAVAMGQTIRALGMHVPGVIHSVASGRDCPVGENYWAGRARTARACCTSVVIWVMSSSMLSNLAIPRNRSTNSTTTRWS